MPFDLIHFSDPQLVPAGKINFDINPQSRLRACVDALLKECAQADACFITGDLTHWGEPEAYETLRQELARLPMPVYQMMGNHDHREAFRTAFPEHPVHDSGFIQYSLNTPAGKLICLDTMENGKRGGFLCEQRLAWLKDELAGNDPVYFFMHHPPFPVGLPAMDSDNLHNAKEFLACLTPHLPRIKHLFFGHLHRQVSGQWHGISYSCPNSLVHQTPFNFQERKVAGLSPEPPLYHRVLIYDDHLVVHARDFLHSEPPIMKDRCVRHPRRGD